MDSIVKALIFLIETLFSIYIILVMLRFLLQWMRTGLHDTPSLFIKQVTDPPLRFLHNFIPRWHHIDTAALVLMLALSIIKLVLISLLRFGSLPSVLTLLSLSVINLLYLLLYFFFFSILIHAIASWIVPYDSYNPLTSFLARVNEPLLRPVRRYIPPLQGIDLSPLVILLALQVAIILLS